MYLFIREERIRRGWTQEYVAGNIGLTRTAVHDIENGKQLPSYKVLIKLEDLFEMNHRELLAPYAGPSNLCKSVEWRNSDAKNKD